jgi:hypothetical protein
MEIAVNILCYALGVTTGVVVAAAAVLYVITRDKK